MCTNDGWKGDAQGRNVGEEYTNDERANRRGDRCAVHAPRRRLLEYTRATSTRREQVTESLHCQILHRSYASHRYENVPPLHHDEREEVHALGFKESVLCQSGGVVTEPAR